MQIAPPGLKGLAVSDTELGAVRGEEGFFHYRQYNAVEPRHWKRSGRFISTAPCLLRHLPLTRARGGPSPKRRRRWWMRPVLE